jgi:hypothetical protein
MFNSQMLNQGSTLVGMTTSLVGRSNTDIQNRSMGARPLVGGGSVPRG